MLTTEEYKKIKEMMRQEYRQDKKVKKMSIIDGHHRLNAFKKINKAKKDEIDFNLNIE